MNERCRVVLAKIKSHRSVYQITDRINRDFLNDCSIKNLKSSRVNIQHEIMIEYVQPFRTEFLQDFCN